MTPQMTERTPGVIRFEVRWREGSRHRSRSFATEELALDFEAELRRRKRMGAHAGPEPSREPFEAFLDRWWAANREQWKPSHRRRQGALIEKWVTPYIGHVPFAELGPERLEEWRETIRRAGCTLSSANRARTALSSAFGWAIRMRMIAYNPLVALPKLPETNRKREAVPVDHVERVRAHLAPIDAAMLSLYAYAGLRPDEPFALRWENVSARSVYLDSADTKTSRARTIDLEPIVAEELEGLRPGPKARGWIRPNRSGGKMRLDNWRPRVLADAISAAGVEPFVPYDLRHTCASLLIHQGESLTYVAAQLGHSVAVLERYYAHVIAEYRRGDGPTPMADVIAKARAGVLQVPVREVYEAAGVTDLRSARRASRDSASGGRFR